MSSMNAIAAQQALTQMNFALSATKNSAKAEQALAHVIDDAARIIQDSTRGQNLNILV